MKRLLTDPVYREQFEQKVIASAKKSAALSRYKEQSAEAAKNIEAVKAEMAEEYGLERNAKFDKAWEIAWGHGHSSGIDEVKLYFGELVELIRP